MIQFPMQNLFAEEMVAHSLTPPADTDLTHTSVLTIGQTVYVFSSGNATTDQSLLDIIMLKWVRR